MYMTGLRFEWDPAKADEAAKLIPDPDHSSGEERFVLLGMSLQLRILVVCHCERASGSVLRLISARKATSHEARQYRSKP
jgi:uncharacterized DUF497 family protein